MTFSTLRRLASDHAALLKADLPPYYLWPAGTPSVAEDLTQLNIAVTGPPGTPYENGLWKLQLKMPSDYPNSPPKAFFRTKIWHPNVDESSGSVCLDTLKRDWQPKLTLRDILITISCLLINPNPDSALNSAAGQLLQENWEQFARHARLMSSIHARIPAVLREAVQEARSRGEEVSVPLTDSNVSSNEEESEDEEENTKENDAPSEPPSRPHGPRPSILGKRPLADLPVPLEPASDDEEATAASTRNIVANTPNLSNQMASVGFEATSAPVWHTTSKSAPIKLAERPFSIHTSTDQLEPATSPPAKRLCGNDGKENAVEGKPIGLGFKVRPQVPPTGRKMAIPKPRVGLRRL